MQNVQIGHRDNKISVYHRKFGNQGATGAALQFNVKTPEMALRALSELGDHPNMHPKPVRESPPLSAPYRSRDELEVFLCVACTSGLVTGDKAKLTYGVLLASPEICAFH